MVLVAMIMVLEMATPLPPNRVHPELLRRTSYSSPLKGFTTSIDVFFGGG